ncbi:streptophobe family protein [Streptomyces huiliensis]|uniref:streptophobe family protein n=1 Tax=Streptomyces huiliensis TaxID=2876027 RepID=UPI001CC0B71E|nr:streptophobe family protein [Streptomyces huiliensis]MBZ4321697.1 streptophobe family protein [Streptomyces huiliensis]
MTITRERRPAPGVRMIVFAVAGVGWAFLAMAGVAALGLHLLGADAAGELGPMTAAVTVLAVGGSVSPSGALEAFGIRGADAHTAIELTPLGVSLVGALVLGWSFARSLRAAGPVVGGRELAVRAGAVAAVFLLLLGGLAWAGSSTLTFQGEGLGLGDAVDSGPKLPKLEIPGVGDIGDIGGGLADRLAGLARAKADVGFSVRTGPSLLGGAVWVAAVLLVAVLVARRAPLPRGAGALHRTVRPAASALCAVLVLAVAAGWAAALVAAAGDDHPRRVAGGALLGAPNGVWLGLPLGLFVPWHGRAEGTLTKVLPDPLDDLLAAGTDRPVTVARLAEYDGRVWLLAVACAVALLLAGVVTTVRTPRGARSAVAYAGGCGLALGAVTAVALPLLALATRVRVDAGLSVLGVDAVGAGLDLRGNGFLAAVLGAAWGLAAGTAGGLLACATGAAGRGAAGYARGERPGGGRGRGGSGGDGSAYGHGRGGSGEGRGQGYGHERPGVSGSPAGGAAEDVPGPHRPSPGYRPARDETNPYLRPRPGPRPGPPPGSGAGSRVDPSATTSAGPVPGSSAGPSGSSSGPSSGSRGAPRPAGPPPERPRRPYGTPPPPPPPPPAPRGWPGPDGRPPRR